MNERMKQMIGSVPHTIAKEIGGTGGEHGTVTRVEPEDVEAVIKDWPDASKKAARKTSERYGEPNEGTPSRLIWFNNGPWKRTIVYRDEVPHNFPKPHTDVLEQFIDYRLPVDKYDDIARYDGSVIPERTKGEVSARCDMEEMNFLALNLMNDVATGMRDVEEARREYASQATAFMLQREAPYTTGLHFETKKGGTADSDQPTLGPMMKETFKRDRTDDAHQERHIR